MTHDQKDNQGAAAILPELKTGDLLKGKNGFVYRVHRVGKKSMRDTGYDEPLYRLMKLTAIRILGNAEFTLDELTEYGMEVYHEPTL